MQTSDWLRQGDSVVVHRSPGIDLSLGIGEGGTMLVLGFGDDVLIPVRQGWFASAHPRFPFYARGPHAAFLIENAPFHYPLGENSPLAKLYQLDGGVLLIGGDH